MKDDKLSTLQFQLELLRLIPKSRRIGTKELQEKLRDSGYERDLRSIQRHLSSLYEQFCYDLDCDGKKPAGYKWKENSSGLNLPLLNEQQSLVLMLARDQLKTLLPANIMKSMEPFLSKQNAIY